MRLVRSIAFHRPGLRSKWALLRAVQLTTGQAAQRPAPPEKHLPKLYLRECVFWILGTNKAGPSSPSGPATPVPRELRAFFGRTGCAASGRRWLLREHAPLLSPMVPLGHQWQNCLLQLLTSYRAVHYASACVLRIGSQLHDVHPLRELKVCLTHELNQALVDHGRRSRSSVHAFLGCMCRW
jgi:hypothetical protein